MYLKFRLTESHAVGSLTVVVVVVVVYLHENYQFSKMYEYNGINIQYHLQFQTHTMQTRPSHKFQNL